LTAYLQKVILLVLAFLTRHRKNVMVAGEIHRVNVLRETKLEKKRHITSRYDRDPQEEKSGG
jgi:hypothetical protein